MKTATVTVKVADLPKVKALLAEREATIQRLIAQADGQAKTIEALAWRLWDTTHHAHFRPAGRRRCGHCSWILDHLESLGLGERMRKWDGG